MAAPTRSQTSHLAFVVALGVSTLGHVAALAGRSDSEPLPVEESATGWNGNQVAVQVFDAPSVPEAPSAPVAPPTEAQDPAVTSQARVSRAEPRTELPPAAPAKQKVAQPKAAPPTEATTSSAAATDQAPAPATETEEASPTSPGETDLEGVITPRETWRAPPSTPRAPSVSGMPAERSPEPQPAPEEARLAPGIARLETAFTRSVPYYNYADPAWDQLPLGRVGSMKLTFVVDASGQIVEATTPGSPPPVLERLRRRTLFGLRRGHFAITKSQVTEGRRTLRIDVFLEQRAVGSQALPAVGFRAPANGRPGVATMHLESGRFVTVQVQPLDN